MSSASCSPSSPTETFSLNEVVILVLPMNESSYNKNRQHLERLMQQVGIPNLKQLSRLAGISQWQLTRLEYGLILKIPVEVLLKLANTLQISLDDLLNLFSSDGVVSFPLSQERAVGNKLSISDNTEEVETLKQDYQRLQQQMEKQRETLTQEFQLLQQQMEQQKDSLRQEFQHSSLQTLESWLVQWPTAAVSAQKNPKLSAIKLLPLLKPMAVLLKQWGVEAIACVGELVPYDPQFHQLMQGQAEPGERVRVRYVGYRQGDKLLYRAKVSSIEIQSSPKTEENQGHNKPNTEPTTALDLRANSPTTILDVCEDVAADAPTSATTVLDVSDSSPTTVLDVSEDAAVDEETAKNIIT